eukprot:12444158-Ditylum_brightwellii.AAC.1
MEEKYGKEGMGRTNYNNTHDEENNIHDKKDEEDGNDETMVDENNKDQITAISVPTNSSTYCKQKLCANSKLISTLLSIDSYAG